MSYNLDSLLSFWLSAVFPLVPRRVPSLSPAYEVLLQMEKMCSWCSNKRALQRVGFLLASSKCSQKLQSRSFPRLLIDPEPSVKITRSQHRAFDVGQLAGEARKVASCQGSQQQSTVDGCEIHLLLAPRFRTPRSIRFPCKYQQTMVSTMVSKWCRISSIHSSTNKLGTFMGLRMQKEPQPN